MNWGALAVEAFWVVYGLGGWVLFLHVREQRQDLLTDLMQLIHDYDVERDELRRSLGYEPVEQRVSDE